MMRTDSKGRSASPHRITYKSDFHAIKCSFDTAPSLQPGTKAAAAAAQRSTRLPSSPSDPIMSNTSTGSRGRVHSTRGTKIRHNIFLQMDSQQLKQDGGPVQSSGSTPLLSPHNPTPQPQTSPFSRSRRSVVSSSSANISTPESSLQDKPSRSEEIADIDRAALAQKFSVTRRLFETKVMEVGGGGRQVSKGRGSKGVADGKGEGDEGIGGVSQVEKEEEERKPTEEDGFDKDKSINLPVINISSPAQASLTRHLKSPVSDGPSESSNKSPTGSQTEEERTATLDLYLTPEEPVRAELVDLKNGSSESDENEEEKDRKSLKDEVENKVAGESVQELVDDVFEEPSMETPGAYMLENRDPEEHQKELSASMLCQTETKDDREGRRGKYEQVNEEWEGEREGQIIAGAEKSTETGDNWEKSTNAGMEESAGRTEMMQEEENDLYSVGKRKDGECKERTEKEEGSTSELQEEVKHEESSDGKEDQICGIENEAFVYEQEHPEHLKQEWENSTRGNLLLLQYEEIPGVPELSDQEEDEEDGAKRKIRFTSAPIKVRQGKPVKKKYAHLFIHFIHSCRVIFL